MLLFEHLLKYELHRVTSKMKLGSQYDLLDTPRILKYKQIYRSKYLQSVEWSEYLHYQPLFSASNFFMHMFNMSATYLQSVEKIYCKL